MNLSDVISDYNSLDLNIIDEICDSSDKEDLEDDNVWEESDDDVWKEIDGISIHGDEFLEENNETTINDDELQVHDIIRVVY
jgi:hypothetical protein